MNKKGPICKQHWKGGAGYLTGRHVPQKKMGYNKRRGGGTKKKKDEGEAAEKEY